MYHYIMFIKENICSLLSLVEPAEESIPICIILHASEISMNLTRSPSPRTIVEAIRSESKCGECRKLLVNNYKSRRFSEMFHILHFVKCVYTHVLPFRSLKISCRMNAF